MLFRSSLADPRSSLLRRCLLCFSTSLSANYSFKHSKEHKGASEQPPNRKSQQQQQQQQQQEQQQQRRLIVAVVGLPNAGKSTLTNRLIGHKISGVSSKRNTTIDPQLGSFAVGSSQVLLYDTPGLVDTPGQGNPVERLRSAWSTAALADQLLLIVDAERQFRLQEQALLKLVQQVAAGPPGTMSRNWQRPSTLLFLNKQDKLDANIRHTVLQQLRQQLCGLLDFQAVFEGAAMKGEGVDQLKAYLIQQAQPGAWLMAAGQSHAASPGELAVELVREKLYRRLNQEIPYRLNVAVEAVGPWSPRPPATATAETVATATAAREPPGPLQSVPVGSVQGEGLYIRVGVVVASKLVKSIVVGKGGEVIQKYVAEPTQAELAGILKQPVKLVVGVRIVG